MTFNAKLAKLLELHNLAAVARRAGVSKCAINAAVTGKHSPRIDTLQKIADAAGVSLAWLLDESAEWPPVRTERQPAAVA